MSDTNKRTPTNLQTPSPDLSESVLLHPRIGQMFAILQARYRRLILLLLAEGSVESQSDVMFRGSRDEGEPDLELVHTHLPKLAEAGYIRWDRETGEIAKEPRFEEIEPLIELIETHSEELPPDWP
jgi:hypothetical protein